MSDYRQRRQQLCNHIGTQGTVLLVSGYEDGHGVFRPDSSFYYYTGLEEPGLFLLLDVPSGETRLLMPTFTTARTDWMAERAQPQGFDAMQSLGSPLAGYQANLYSDVSAYSNLAFEKDAKIYTLYPPDKSRFSLYTQVIMYLARLGLLQEEQVQDISAHIGQQRSIKDAHEREAIQHAVDITMQAHAAVATVIKPGTYEREIQAGIEYLFTDAGADCAFPSIVATGKNSVVLHYNAAQDQVRPQDLIVVDIGARKDGYCADLTRTYPATGRFTVRQRAVYDTVLATQDYIARKVRAGMFLRNAQKPELSLHHLAVQFLEQKGFAKYFIHGIGHHLGIDVHDVADATRPLEEGAVFTIEPGIYIAQEKLGVRIEDNYILTARGAECLSQDLPKTARDIEEFMSEGEEEFEDEE